MNPILVPDEQKVPYIHSVVRKLWFGGGPMHGKFVRVITLVPKHTKHSWRHIKTKKDIEDSLTNIKISDVTKESQAIIIIGKNCDPLQFDCILELDNLVKVCLLNFQINERMLYIHTNGQNLFHKESSAYSFISGDNICVNFVIEPKPIASKYKPIPIENLIDCSAIIVRIEEEPNSPYHGLDFFPVNRTMVKHNTNNTKLLSKKLYLMPRNHGGMRELLANIDHLNDVVRGLLTMSRNHNNTPLLPTIQFPDL